jgi:hypothetical protein
VCSGKGNEPVEPIVRDILVPVQRDHAACVEIANREFLYVWRIKNRARQGNTEAGPYSEERAS